MEGAPIAYLGVGLTTVLFLFGVVYQLGKFAARLEALESWRSDMKSELNALHLSLRELGDLMRQGNR